MKYRVYNINNHYNKIHYNNDYMDTFFFCIC